MALAIHAIMRGWVSSSHFLKISLITGYVLRSKCLVLGKCLFVFGSVYLVFKCMYLVFGSMYLMFRYLVLGSMYLVFGNVFLDALASFRPIMDSE